jgi:ribosomal protein S8E
VPEDGEDHQMGSQPVKIAKQDTVGYHKLKIFHIAIGVGHGRVIVEHQQYACDEENDEQDEGDRSQVIRGSHAQGLPSNLDRQPVKEEISEDREATRSVCVRGAAPKDRPPDSRLAKVLQCGMKSRSHRLP